MHPSTVPSLPAPVQAALEAPSPPDTLNADAARIAWSALAWGDPSDRPLLLLHGVNSSARTWWRVGPALAATGRRVIAPDLPGHGLTGQWTGNPAFRHTAELVAAFWNVVGAGSRNMQVVGHSWGACITAALPAAGLRPAAMVLIDPPAASRSFLITLDASPDERPYADRGAAARAVRAANPTWGDGDIEAKAEALTQLDPEASRAVLGDNGDFDAGLSDLADPAARGVPVWIVRGEPASGGLLPDEWLPRFEAVIGPGRIVTVQDGPHSPYRSHPVEVTAAILDGLSS